MNYGEPSELKLETEVNSFYLQSIDVYRYGSRSMFKAIVQLAKFNVTLG
jgi:hypothetical protein